MTMIIPKGIDENEFKLKVRAILMKESPKVRRLPKKLYHGTKLENMNSILEKGLKVDSFYGQIFFCESIEDVLLFIPKPCVIFEIDTAELLKKRFRVSLDHNKKVYPCEAYAYYKDIPVNSLTGVTKFE